MFTKETRDTVESIIQIFETGRISKNSYGTVTNLRGDTGGLTYGKHQASITSGSLHLMIKMYTQTPGAKYGMALMPYLPRLLNADRSLATTAQFTQLLREAGNDPIMQQAQDRFFYLRYMKGAEDFCATRGFVQPLTLAIVYDSLIHGSFKRINARVKAQAETLWARSYCEARRAWLATSPNHLLRKTVYRPDTFLGLIINNKWPLPLPLPIRGVTIRANAVNAQATVSTPVDFCVSTTQPVLRLGAKGAEVVDLQNLLRLNGFQLLPDGDFGESTERAVRAFQSMHHLSVDGIVGPVSWDRMDDIMPAAAA